MNRRSLFSFIGLALLLVAVPGCTPEVAQLALQDRSCRATAVPGDEVPRLVIVTCTITIACGGTAQTVDMSPDTIPSPDP